MLFYSLPGIIALLMLVITNFDVLFYKNYKARNKKALIYYRIFLSTLAGFYVCDILWGIFDSAWFDTKIYVSIDTSFFFLFMAALLLSWSNFVIRYIDDKTIFRQIVRITGYLFATMGVVLVIVNFFHPVLFTYQTGDAYTAKLGRYIFLGSQFALFSVIAVYSFIYGFTRKVGKLAPYVTIGLFSVVMAGGVVLQLYYPLYPVYTCACAMGSMLLHTFLVLTEKNIQRQELVDSQERENELTKDNEEIRELAYIDPLTGVKNKHAYVELESKIDTLIHDKEMKDFALLIFDLNDLKLINDTYGHDTGDIYIKKSCEIINKFFPNNDIYRYGGDEFIVILQGNDYDNRLKNIDEFNKFIESNIGSDEPIIAVGFADFIVTRDNTLRTVFVRADEMMYNRKRKLKSMSSSNAEESKNNVSTGASLLNLRYEMYEMFYRSANVSLIDMLNSSSCDEIVEVDIYNDTFKQFYHVDGKYFVPAVEISYDELLNFTYKHIVHPDDRGVYQCLMKKEGFFERLKNARIPNFDIAHFRYKLQDGKYRYVEQVVIAGEEYGIPEGMFRMYVFDIENIKKRQIGNIKDESNVVSVGRDPVTGLLVSKEFFKKAEEMITSDKEKQWCLVSIDIEHFKFFDEWFGREKGDYLLAKIGAVIKEFEAEYGALAGYFGADDFSILCEFNKGIIEGLYERIRTEINSFGLATGFLPAFGVSLIDKDMILVDAFDRSTIAIAKAKNDLKNRITYYSLDMQFKADQEYRMLTGFIHAIQDNEITFFLQPQCRIETGALVGAEALARWIKKDGTVVPPGEIVPILEQYGFITDLDKVIWDRVVKWIGERKAKGLKCIPISVNVSRIDVLNLDIVGFFKELCEKYKVPHNLIKLEITESAYADTSAIMDQMIKDLRSEGFMVLMDDFGSGYSSLNMLSNTKIDAIKLDANFLHIQNSDLEKGIHILESVINMAKTMALPIIVEGAEKKNQVDFLQEIGCQYVQGYYFYKPMPIADFEALIADGKKIDSKGLVSKLNDQFRMREFMDKNIYSDSMLNNIIGSVAIYSQHKNHVDIVRFNQQFFETVGVPDFAERLENIENFLPEEDRPKLFEALKEAKENKFTGSSVMLRFFLSNGTLSTYRMQFYYIGKKEGNDRFYGSAINETELADLKDNKKLIAKYSEDNMIFVRRIDNKWNYSVVSHALSEEIGLNPAELEAELNEGKFVKRITPQSDIKNFMKMVDGSFENQKHYEHQFTIVTNTHKKVKISISIDYVGDEANNIKFILRTHKVED